MDKDNKDASPDKKFDTALNDIVTYYQEKGVTNIPILDEEEILRLPIDLIGEKSDIKLNPFIRRMRRNKRDGVLSEYREEKLNDILGSSWRETNYTYSDGSNDGGVYIIPSYKFGFKLAMKFKNKYHRLPKRNETWVGEVSGKKYNVGEFVYGVQKVYMYPDLYEKKYARYQGDLKKLFE